MALTWSMVLKKLNSIPGFSATAQHVALFKDLYEQAQKECDRLEKECAALRAENSALKEEVQSLPVELIDVEGLLLEENSIRELRVEAAVSQLRRPPHSELHSSGPRNVLALLHLQISM